MTEDVKVEVGEENGIKVRILARRLDQSDPSTARRLCD